ncbi:condensin-2 complex subunit H2 [Nephila pilipes]|uniref:Condensin-2 complex subunit H2 n=1 Tax=Nephila pilipes TaxID=299642 RepID=A0A8X6Q497_NEPPI|nr:condensin-2 complex subunit H2 [Nephila pilipes]
MTSAFNHVHGRETNPAKSRGDLTFAEKITSPVHSRPDHKSFFSDLDRMASSLETHYKDLLNPIKDPEQSFTINLSELLQRYVKMFSDGEVPANFNSAALLLQGSCSIYGKRVEYLYTLAHKLNRLLLNKKEDKTKKDPKEKQTKESKFSDPFCATEIKRGKNLSCLRKKLSAKSANKKASKKVSDKRFTFVPVDLLPLEGEEKGDVFYDTRGEVVGNKGDYTLNKCRVTKSGWLLLPTVSPELVESDPSSPDYTIEEQMYNCTPQDSDMPESTPADEGYPPSTGCSGTPGSEDGCSQTPGSEDGCSQTPGSDDPCSQGALSQGTDEGLGSLPCTPQESDSQTDSVTNTPMDAISQPELEDESPDNDFSPSETPMEGVEENAIGDANLSPEGIENIPIGDADVGRKPRRSMRQALKLCQLEESVASKEQEENALQKQVEEVAAIKRGVEKKKTSNLPSKLKAKEKRNENIFSASEFCARTFFSLDAKFQKNCVHVLGVSSFKKNSFLYRKFLRIAKSLKLSIRRKKRRKKNNNVVVDESADVDIGEMEDLQEFLEHDDDDDDDEDDDDDNEEKVPRLDDDDIVIESNPPSVMSLDNNNPTAEEEPACIYTEDVELPCDNDEPPPCVVESPRVTNARPSSGGDGNNQEDAEDDIDSDDHYFREAAIMQVNLYKEELQQYIQTSDIMERFHEWEGIMRPYLEGLKQRSNFDINLYGSNILDAFGNTNRKQTITFRNFCRNKEKYEIHRYFMALLPLVNVGNVSIEIENRKDGSEDILVTLLSRKMHHTELEEFGHTSGEHS